MKNKIFSSLVLGMFLLTFLVGAVSAVTLAEWTLNSTGSASNVDVNVIAGDFTNSSGISSITCSSDGARANGWTNSTSADSDEYFQITIAPKSGKNLSISKINFGDMRTNTGPEDYQLKWSKSSSFGTSATINTYTSANNSETIRSESTSIEVGDGETLYLRWFAYNADASSGNFYITDNTLNIEGTVANATSPSTPTQSFCTFENGTTTNVGELEVRIKDINIVEGYGKNEEWGLLDEIEIEIKVKNKGKYDIDDISLEWGIADENLENWVVDMDEEDEFNLKDGKEDTYIITFRINEKNLDMDFDELSRDYKLYARITGTTDDRDSPNNGEPSCAEDSENIKFLIDSDFVILDKLTIPELASCGDVLQITADIWNIGDNDQEDVYVKIFNSELGLNSKIEIGDIDAFDRETLSTSVTIPKGAEEKNYNLRFEVYDEDDDIFESDEFDEQAVFFSSVTVSGGCKAISSSAVAVSANLVSGGKAGEDMVVKATIANLAGSASYNINVAGYADWASLATLDSNTFTLAESQSKDVTITFKVKDDVSGDKSFDIEILSDGKLVKTQPVSVTITGKSGLSSITGGFLGGNSLIWGIGILNVILIIIIIVVAVRIIGK